MKLISESKNSGRTYVRVASCMLLHNFHKEKTDELKLTVVECSVQVLNNNVARNFFNKRLMIDVIIRGVVSGQNFRALRARRESCGAFGPAAWPDQSKHACYAPVMYP